MEQEATQHQGPLSSVEPLPAEALYRSCDPARLGFTTTNELEAPVPFIGQPRAVEAVQFGIGIRRDGYHIFALGAAGMGRRALVSHFLKKAAAERPVPSDWCYVDNFEQSRNPRVLRLPPGRGKGLQKDMVLFVEHLQAALPAAFESEEYQMRHQAVREETREEHDHDLEKVQEQAQAEGLTLLRTPTGFAFAPYRDGAVLSPEEVKKLTEAEQQVLTEAVDGLQEELLKVMRGLPKRLRLMQEKLRQLNREVAEYAVGDLIGELKKVYADLEDVGVYLDDVKEDIVDNVQRFTGQQEQGNLQVADGDGSQEVSMVQQAMSLRNYSVNVLVDHSASEAAPIIEEENPTYPNLLGRVEHVSQMGTLVTDFGLIRAGALHRANGGFLVVDARAILMQPFAWEGLKRALKSREIRLESPGESMGLISTVSLEPETIPLDVKVVLVGDPSLYYLLDAYDPDFRELFKVMADFDGTMDRTEENEQQYAVMVAYIARKAGLRPLDAAAVARVIEHGTRLADDAEKLSTHLQALTDLLSEADHWAGTESADVVEAAHVQRAIDAQIYRSDRLRERIHESILRETIYVSTEGEAVGQVNGLAVLQVGNFAFGKPNRITARVRLGSGKIIDIEREAEMGGPIHTKGVMILSGFMSGRYAREVPLSFTASLVFEQSYGGIEGDSASVAELVALLSALAEVPVRQAFAVTGSVNQHGQVQPIGGVNEKVEGYFDVCKARGLTGEQGILIPASNVKNLMLRRDVVEAVEQGQFVLYPIETVDEALTLFSGLPAGRMDTEGHYPEGSFNALVEARLTALATQRQQFGSENGQKGKG